MDTRLAPALLCCLLLGASPAHAQEADAKPAAVEVIKDVPYYEGKDADADRHKLDLYLPRDRKDFPVLVYVHGGGWTKGDRKTFEKQGRMLAAHGVGAASVGYRLSVRNADQAEDVARAFAWVKKNVGKYGGRADQLFIGGHSAGGQLAALLATDPKYLQAQGLALADVRGAIPISGVYVVSGNWNSTVFGKDEADRRQASPQSHLKPGGPPFLILVAANESTGFVKMAEAFGKAVQAEKGEATCLKIEDRTHSTIMSRMATPEDPAARAILDFIAAHARQARPALSPP